MATISSLSLSTPRISPKASSDSPKAHTIINNKLNYPWNWNRSSQFGPGRIHIRPAAAVPEGLSEKVAESIKSAEEACSDDPVSGECAAAWDEVEELSAAASHARDKMKESDPLETFCKDNMDTEECRTYDD
ncbi:unnamed protein product [Camellia sinensis]